jgi:hypothetical protein
MTTRRGDLVIVGVVVLGLAIAALLGFGAGLAVGYASRGESKHEDVTGFAPQVWSMLSDFKKNKIIRHRRIRLIDRYVINVGIVADTNNVEYGFTKVDDLFRKFDVLKDGVTVIHWTDNYLYVVLRQREIARLQMEADSASNPVVKPLNSDVPR